MDETGPELSAQFSKRTQIPRTRPRWTRQPRFRDREAPGSNPEPPDFSETKLPLFEPATSGSPVRSKLSLERSESEI
jgi:hypothetical protein